MLRIRDVTKKFGELVALNNVNIEVEKGERLGIIGPNGAGKTTLFNIISGFLHPDTGEVIFEGKNIVGRRPNELAKMGLVRTFQIAKVFKNMSVEENILAVDSCDPSSIEILKTFGLWNKRDWLACNLSHGELRKLSIAMALATNPRVLLLDEPFSGLSPREAKNLAETIHDLGEDGFTLVVIEHKLKELFNVSERVVVLNSGRVIFDGKPEDVVKDNRVIQAYLGKKYARVHA
jgi:branched-chain amino acid transport system ATP-binding protein